MDALATGFRTRLDGHGRGALFGGQKTNALFVNLLIMLGSWLPIPQNIESIRIKLYSLAAQDECKISDELPRKRYCSEMFYPRELLS